MKRTTTILTAASLLAATAATADGLRSTGMKTHASQGEIADVAGSVARLATHNDGVFVNVETAGLTPGNVHTLWFVVINNPAACETPYECVTKDVLKRSEIVASDVGYAGGVIVGPDGTATFAWHQAEGALSGGWFGTGMTNVAGAEIHLVVNDHGPLIEGREFAMLNTYRDGCTDKSIPAPMPDTARAQGEAGPNQCRLMQFSIFRSIEKSS